MLTDLTLRYSALGVWEMAALKLGVALLGGLIAWVTVRETRRLPRVPYFACVALLAALVTGASLIWIFSLPAIKGGYVGLFMLFEGAVLLAAGFVLGRLALARAQDVHGFGWPMVLAFVPLLNLWLILAPSRAGAEPWGWSVWTGWRGALIGLAGISAVGALTAYDRAQAEVLFDKAAADMEVQKIVVASSIRSIGLEAALEELAQATTAMQVDAITVLEGAEGQGETLVYTYLVVSDMTALPDAAQAGILAQNCANEVMHPVLEAGGALEHRYESAGRDTIGMVRITQAICEEAGHL